MDNQDPERRSDGKKVIQESGLFLNKEDMSHLKIADVQPLDAIKERDVCIKCRKSRMYFCYTCYTIMDPLKELVPRVKLPLSVDIIKHAREGDGKCTSSHAAIIAPDDVQVHLYPDIPDYGQTSVLLVFPAKDSSTLEECVKSSSKDFSSLPFKRVVFIDSTWRQTKLILNDEKIKHLPSVALNSHLSLFWRHQREKPLTCLSTIEAVYYFFVDLHMLFFNKYDGRYDNLLFFFKHTLLRVRKLYVARKQLQLHERD